MRHARALGTALLLSLALPGALSAQTASTRLSDAPPPAEFPPASFTGPEYVDSAGCLYARGGEGATSIWVPRVTANRRVICGLQPTLTRTGRTDAPVIADAHDATSVHQAGQRAVAGTLEGGTVIAVPAPPPIEVPKGYRPAWEDGRLNPYAGKQLLSGALQQALVWTQTVPRRLKTQSGEDMTSRYRFLVYPYTDYAKQRAALGSGNYIIIETTAGREIVPRY